MLHTEIFHIEILLLLEFSWQQLLDLSRNIACASGFITMSISITSVKRKIESIRNKNSASQVYWGILQYFYLVLGIFYYDFLNSYFPELHLVSAADD